MIPNRTWPCSWFKYMPYRERRSSSMLNSSTLEGILEDDELAAEEEERAEQEEKKKLEQQMRPTEKGIVINDEEDRQPCKTGTESVGIGGEKISMGVGEERIQTGKLRARIHWFSKNRSGKRSLGKITEEMFGVTEPGNFVTTDESNSERINSPVFIRDRECMSTSRSVRSAERFPRYNKKDSMEYIELNEIRNTRDNFHRANIELQKQGNINIYDEACSSRSITQMGDQRLHREMPRERNLPFAKGDARERRNISERLEKWRHGRAPAITSRTHCNAQQIGFNEQSGIAGTSYPFYIGSEGTSSCLLGSATQNIVLENDRQSFREENISLYPRGGLSRRDIERRIHSKDTNKTGKEAETRSAFHIPRFQGALRDSTTTESFVKAFHKHRQMTEISQGSNITETAQNPSTDQSISYCAYKNQVYVRSINPLHVDNGAEISEQQTGQENIFVEVEHTTAEHQPQLEFTIPDNQLANVELPKNEKKDSLSLLYRSDLEDIVPSDIWNVQESNMAENVSASNQKKKLIKQTTGEIITSPLSAKKETNSGDMKITTDTRLHLSKRTEKQTLNKTLITQVKSPVKIEKIVSDKNTKRFETTSFRKAEQKESQLPKFSATSSSVRQQNSRLSRISGDGTGLKDTFINKGEKVVIPNKSQFNIPKKSPPALKRPHSSKIEENKISVKAKISDTVIKEKSKRSSEQKVSPLSITKRDATDMKHINKSPTLKKEESRITKQKHRDVGYSEQIRSYSSSEVSDIEDARSSNICKRGDIKTLRNKNRESRRSEQKFSCSSSEEKVLRKHISSIDLLQKEKERTYQEKAKERTESSRKRPLERICDKKNVIKTESTEKVPSLLLPATRKEPYRHPERQEEKKYFLSVDDTEKLNKRRKDTAGKKKISGTAFVSAERQERLKVNEEGDAITLASESDTERKTRSYRSRYVEPGEEEDIYFQISSDDDSADSVIQRDIRKRRRAEDGDKFKRSRTRKKPAYISRRDEEISHAKYRSSFNERQYTPRKYIHEIREITPEISREECLSLISMTDDRDEILSLLSQSEIGLGTPLIYRSDSEDDYLPHYYRERDSRRLLERGDHTIIVTKEGGHLPELWDDDKIINRKRYSNINRIRILGERRRIGRRRRSRDRSNRTIIIERRPPRERWSLRERRKAEDRRRARERVRLDRLLSYAREDYPEDPVVIIMPRQDPWETEELTYRPRSPVRDRDFDYCRDVEAGPSSRPDVFYGYRQYDYETPSQRAARPSNVQCENIHRVFPKEKYPPRSKCSQSWDLMPSAPNFLTRKSDAWTECLEQKDVNVEVNTAFPENPGRPGFGAAGPYRQLSERNPYRTQKEDQYLQRSSSPTIQLFSDRSPIETTPLQSSSYYDDGATTPIRIRSALKKPGSVSSKEKHCRWSEYNLVVEPSTGRPDSEGFIFDWVAKMPLRLCLLYAIKTLISISTFILMVCAYNRGLGHSQNVSSVQLEKTDLNTYACNKVPKNFLMNCSEPSATVRVSFNGPFMFTYEPDPVRRHFNYQFERWYLNKLTFNPRYIRRPEWPGESLRYPEWERKNCTLWLIEVKHTSKRSTYIMTRKSISVRSTLSFVPGYRNQRERPRQAHAKDLGQFKYVNMTYTYITRSENSTVKFIAAPMNKFKLKKYRFYGYKINPFTSEYYEYEEEFEDFRKVPGRVLPNEQVLANGTHDNDLSFVYALRYVLDISKDAYAPPFIVELNAPFSNTTEKDELFYGISAFSIRPGIGKTDRNITNITPSSADNNNKEKLHTDGLKLVTYLLGGTLLMILLQINLMSIIFIIGVGAVSLMSYLEIWNPDRMMMRVRCDELLYLLYTMILFTMFADTGVFGYAAFYLRLIIKDKIGALLSILCAMTILLTVLFTNNVFSMQFMTLFGIRCSEEYNLNPVPLLILLSILSNIAGIMTSCSSYVTFHFFQWERLQQSYKSFTALPLAMLFTFLVTSTFAFSYFVFIFKAFKPHVYESIKIEELKQEVKLWKQMYATTNSCSHENILIRHQIMSMIQQLKAEIKEEELKIFSESEGERVNMRDSQSEVKLEDNYITDVHFFIKIIISAFIFLFFNCLRKFHICLVKDNYCFDEVSIMWSMWTGLGMLLILTDPNWNLLIRKLDWATIVAYVSLLFVQEFVSNLNLHLWLKEKIFENGVMTLNGYFKTLFFSSASAATITYIPFIDVWISFLKEVSAIWPTYDVRELFGVINIGLNIGASATVLGSPATITCLNVSAQQGYKITYTSYLKYALPITVFNLFVASATYILIL